MLASEDSLAFRSIPCHPFLLCICFLALHWPTTREGEPVCGLGDSSLPFPANRERGAGSPQGDPGGGRDFTGPCLYRTHMACLRMRDIQTCLRVHQLLRFPHFPFALKTPSSFLGNEDLIGSKPNCYLFNSFKLCSL